MAWLADQMVPELDPLVALGTVLTTHSLYAGLIWRLRPSR